MFTGIIQGLGKVIQCQRDNIGMTLSVAVPELEPIAGESIAVHGVCLTVLPTSCYGKLDFDVSMETRNKTMLDTLDVGDEVHIERALSVGDRFGGHYVHGHVDTVAYVQDIRPCGDCLELNIGNFVDPHALKYLIPKGSVSICGVSLTINAVVENGIKVMLIPHTLTHTIFQSMQVGDLVNIEYDYMARIITHYVDMMRQGSMSLG